MRAAARLLLLILATALGCGVYGEPVRESAATRAAGGETCAAGETCESPEQP